MEAQESTINDVAGCSRSMATPLAIGVMPGFVLVETLSPVGIISWYLP